MKKGERSEKGHYMHVVPYRLHHCNQKVVRGLDRWSSDGYPRKEKAAGWSFMQESNKIEQDQAFRTFRDQVKEIRSTNKVGWEKTRKLVAPQALSLTFTQLMEAVEQASLPPSLQHHLLQVLHAAQNGKVADQAKSLQQLTGLPASKAIRALCLTFALCGNIRETRGIPGMLPEQVEEVLRSSFNPYDMLCAMDVPSLLDIGAGDLTFERELVDFYLSHRRTNGPSLLLHAVDRLQPASRFGGVYHADSEHRRYLEQFSEHDLAFRFWGGVDVTELSRIRDLLPWYGLVTCHAPANPTFAFEPTRLSPKTIKKQLTKTKGDFRKAIVKGEEVLEVSHRDRVLTFPPWKFDIHGPLVLLDSMARAGGLCILSAIDGEVFWETIAQLLADDRYRPQERILTKQALPEIFGSLYSEFTRLAIGDRMILSDSAELRQSLPEGRNSQGGTAKPIGIRYVEIRRGALLPGIPSGFTARQFAHMSEEDDPWWILFVPERER